MKKNKIVTSIWPFSSTFFLDGRQCTVKPQCVVPENIDTSPMDVFWFEPPPHPTGNSRLASYFPLKTLAFEMPYPLGISNNHP